MLNDAARAAINELASSGVADLTPDEVVSLHECGERLLAAGRETAEGGVALTLPVECGGLLLHPPTLCATDFMSRWTKGKLDDGTFWAVVYALVHAREPDVLEGITSKYRLWRECLALRRRCHATVQELWAALAEALGGGSVMDRETEARTSLDDIAAYVAEHDKVLADFIVAKVSQYFNDNKAEAAAPKEALFWRKKAAELGVLTGVSPDYWYSQDRRLVLKCYLDAQKVAMAHGGMFTPAQKDSVPTAVLDAVRAMQDCKNAIIERRKKHNGK